MSSPGEPISGDRMLDLQTGIHFEEVERAIRTNDELDCAR